jgi:hypothetical protein
MTVSNLSAVGAFLSLVLAMGRTAPSRLRVDDTVGKLLAHPAFAGFGRLLLPWDDRRVDTSMRLGEIGSLLPYFFFRGKPGAPFAVIAPGGGFAYVASVHEGFAWMPWLAATRSPIPSW